jgi:hypothetical protein
MRQKFWATKEGQGVFKGFWVGFWPKVDQGWPKGSWGFVDDVFEVMAQVDRYLTKVNTVDLLIRVNNSGWKPGASQPTPLNIISSRDSTTILKQHLLMRQSLQRCKIYSLTLLDSENSDRANGTWCSTHCLNTVHEGADDECAHEKLKEDKLRRWCRGTSLQASSEGTRTSPRTEPWSAM